MSSSTRLSSMASTRGIRLDGRLNGLLIRLDLRDLGRGQPHAREHGGRVGLNLRDGGGAGQCSLSNRIEVILDGADRGVRWLASARRVILKVRLQRLHGGLDGGPLPPELVVLDAVVDVVPLELVLDAVVDVVPLELASERGRRR